MSIFVEEIEEENQQIDELHAVLEDLPKQESKQKEEEPGFDSENYCFFEDQYEDVKFKKKQFDYSIEPYFHSKAPVPALNLVICNHTLNIVENRTNQP